MVKHLASRASGDRGAQPGRGEIEKGAHFARQQPPPECTRFTGAGAGWKSASTVSSRLPDSASAA